MAAEIKDAAGAPRPAAIRRAAEEFHRVAVEINRVRQLRERDDLLAAAYRFDLNTGEAGRLVFALYDFLGPATERFLDARSGKVGQAAAQRRLRQAARGGLGRTERAGTVRETRSRTLAPRARQHPGARQPGRPGGVRTAVGVGAGRPAPGRLGAPPPGGAEIVTGLVDNYHGDFSGVIALRAARAFGGISFFEGRPKCNAPGRSRGAASRGRT